MRALEGGAELLERLTRHGAEAAGAAGAGADAAAGAGAAGAGAGAGAGSTRSKADKHGAGAGAARPPTKPKAKEPKEEAMLPSAAAVVVESLRQSERKQHELKRLALYFTTVYTILLCYYTTTHTRPRYCYTILLCYYTIHFAPSLLLYYTAMLLRS